MDTDEERKSARAVGVRTVETVARDFVGAFARRTDDGTITEHRRAVLHEREDRPARVLGVHDGQTGWLLLRGGVGGGGRSQDEQQKEP